MIFTLQAILASKSLVEESFVASPLFFATSGTFERVYLRFTNNDCNSFSHESFLFLATFTFECESN